VTIVEGWESYHDDKEAVELLMSLLQALRECHASVRRTYGRPEPTCPSR
jgi:hypothetical protein